MDQCLFEAIHGREPEMEKCKKCGECEKCCYWFVDGVCKTIKEWKDEAHVTEPILIKYDYNRQKLIIYTTKPGRMIGMYGSTYNKYKPILKEHLLNYLINHNGLPESDNLIEFVDCNDVIV